MTQQQQQQQQTQQQQQQQQAQQPYLSSSSSARSSVPTTTAHLGLELTLAQETIKAQRSLRAFPVTKNCTSIQQQVQSHRQQQNHGTTTTTTTSSLVWLSSGSKNSKQQKSQHQQQLKSGSNHVMDQANETVIESASSTVVTKIESIKQSTAHEKRPLSLQGINQDLLNRGGQLDADPGHCSPQRRVEPNDDKKDEGNKHKHKHADVDVNHHHDDENHTIRADDNDDDSSSSGASSSTCASSSSSSSSIEGRSVSLLLLPSWPVVLVDTEQILGYVPRDPIEARAVQQQIQATLYYGERQEQQQQQQQQLPLDDNPILSGPALFFEESVVELFARGMAHHSDTQELQQQQQQETFHNRTANVIYWKQHEQQDGNATTRVDLPQPQDGMTTDLSITTIPEPNDRVSFRFIVIEYPLQLAYSKENGSSNNEANSKHKGDANSSDCTVVSTAHMWKRLLRRGDQNQLRKQQPKQHHHHRRKKHDALFLADPAATQVVQRIQYLLQRCNRSLTWKYAMTDALWDLAARELHRKHQHACWQWKTIQRPKQLESLYAARETFHYQLERAQQNWNQLVEQRNVDVAVRLRQQRYEQQQKQCHTSATQMVGGLEAFDFESTIFSYPEDQPIWTENILGFTRDNEDETWQPDELLLEEPPLREGSSSNSYASSSSSSSCDADNNDAESWSSSDADADCVENENGASKEEKERINGRLSESVVVSMEPESTTTHLLKHVMLPPMPVDTRRRQQRKQHRRRQRRQKQEQERLIALQEQQIKVEQQNHLRQLQLAKAEEAATMQDACTKPELRMAQAVVDALQRRLQQVDDLLESLQEEEWADQEEEEEEQEKQQQQQQQQHDGTVMDKSQGNDFFNGDTTKDSMILEREPPSLSTNRTLSVLDQILAMILGATTSSSVLTLSLSSSFRLNDECHMSREAQHIQWLEQQHESIVTDWLHHFGRLPPTTIGGADRKSLSQTVASSDTIASQQSPIESNRTEEILSHTETSSTRKDALLGIVDNNTKGNWDDDSDHELNPNIKSITKKTNSCLVGLRPGGRVG